MIDKIVNWFRNKSEVPQAVQTDETEAIKLKMLELKTIEQPKDLYDHQSKLERIRTANSMDRSAGS